jgi:uncharacterized RDD family membrane protein YckC
MHFGPAHGGAEIRPIQTATAPDLIAMAREVIDDTPPTPSEPPRVSYQRQLFREMQQVMPIPALRHNETAADLAPPPRRARTGRRVHADQQALDFAAPRVRTALEAVIYSDAPVAAPVHRALAAALDLSMIVMALGVFLVTFELAGGSITINSHTLPLFGGIAAVLGLFYHVLFAIGNGDTPGMCWAQLQLLNFDGQKPDRDQRTFHLAASCLSILAAGLGLLWALVDEEKLTWHDHMSHTFPSPRHRDDE